MESSMMHTRKWAEEQFGSCQLGDRRRSQRLVEMASQVAENPSASFPGQCECWSDLKAAYRLFDVPEVTFEAVAGPHWEATRACGRGRLLIIGDTTELDFGIQRNIPELGPTGNGRGRGFLLHSALMVEADCPRVVGLAGQAIHYRRPAPKKENAARRRKRERESDVWGRVIDQVGSPAKGQQWIHVFDRGADNFEVFCHCYQRGVDLVVRAAQLHRHVMIFDGEKMPLKEQLSRFPVAGTYELNLRARPRQPARMARLEVRFGRLMMPRPSHISAYVQSVHPEPFSLCVVWVREIDSPGDVEPIGWVLYTSLDVANFEDARTVIGYYEKRWLIEEWHKALKSGCRVTERQLKTRERLEAMVGLMGVVAVRLLQLKALARTEPKRPAVGTVPQQWIEMLGALRKWPTRTTARLTVYQFYRELAKLGGFLGRKHDGEPGWITIWRGWEKLNVMVQGYNLAQQHSHQKHKIYG